MAMVYLKLVDGMVIPRTLSTPVAHGSVAGAAMAVVPARARSTSTTVSMVPTASSVSAPFSPRLERKRLAL